MNLRKEIKKRWLSILFYTLIIIFIFSSSAKSWVLQQVVSTGLLKAEIKDDSNKNLTEAVPFSFTDSNGKTATTADLKGKVVFINFWASWCSPCKEEAPLLENSWKQMQAQGKDVVFVGIDFQEARPEALSFLQAYTITYPLVLDTHGTVAEKYDITGLPDTIFINRSGTVVGKVSQQITSQLLTQNLQLII